jgi:ECF transporter S component (folate family)
MKKFPSREWSVKDTRILVLMGLFVALSVVFTRIFQLNLSPFNRATLQFVPAIFSSMLLGPWLGGVIGAVSDVTGYFLFPTGGAFFPGFTFSAFLSAVIYGFFLYKKPKTLLRIVLAVLVVSVIVDLGLNTLWLSILYDKAGITFFFPRAIKTAVLFPIQVIVMQLLWRYVGKRAQRQFDLP